MNERLFTSNSHFSLTLSNKCRNLFSDISTHLQHLKKTLNTKFLCLTKKICAYIYHKSMKKNAFYLICKVVAVINVKADTKENANLPDIYAPEACVCFCVNLWKYPIYFFLFFFPCFFFI